MNENFNAIQYIPIRIMSAESLISCYFGISMISFHHVIIDNNRKSASHDFLIYYRYYLPLRKNPDQRFNLFMCPENIFIGENGHVFELDGVSVKTGEIVPSGRILVDGQDIQDVTVESLRRNISPVLQDTFLFNGTLGENIALGKPDASREEIAEAARRAGLEEFIKNLPQGYDTPMGQMGARLSGGERQRVGIARVMLLDPDVIVMDEPTSSLDVLHEKELLRTLQEACGDKLLLIVSHRPSTLTGCDRIVRLENGRAVEEKGGMNQ